MPKFRKKPVVIEAIQFTESNALEIYDFCRIVIFECGVPIIHTLEGDMKVDVNDWVIKGIKGEFYPCKPDIFEQTYEKV